MENKISERNVVLGLTIVSMVLIAGMMVMPSVVAPQADAGHVYKMYKLGLSGKSFNPWVETGKVVRGLALISGLAIYYPNKLTALYAAKYL